MPRIFEYGLDSPELGSLLLSLIAAFISCFLVAQPPSARRTGARVLAVALLAVLSHIVGGPLLLTVTLLVFAAGEAFLVQDDERASRLGLSCFLAGQIGYAVLFFRGVEAALYLSQPWRAAAAILLLIAVVWIVRAAGLMAGVFRLPILASLTVSVVAAMLAFGTVLPGLMAGAALLVVSTVLVAMRFAPSPEKWLPLPGWVLHYLAHMLIVLAALALL